MFIPYRKDDVRKEEFVRVALPQWGSVWATIFRHSLNAQETLGEVFGVQILGTGEQPGVWFSGLPQKTKDILYAHAKENGLISLPKSQVLSEVGRVRTEKKAMSSKENGRKGGRPKTSPLTRQEQQREYQRKRRAAAKAKPE
jgi:hypothetical protein